MQLWTDVRRFVLVEGNSKREACRKFGLHWQTLEKILGNAQPPGYRMQARRPKPLIGDFLPVIQEILIADRQAPRKQRHTAKRIFERLRDEHDYQGGYTSVKDAVRQWRQVNAETFVPLSHPAGEAQVDYGFAKVMMAGELIEVALFVMSLPYSDAFFVKAYPKECTETFQDGHVEAFEFFGGVPTRISYDNSRVMVAKFVGPRQRELTEGFLCLQSHHLFKEHFCLIRKANEKGHIENLVGYTRNNFLVPVPEFNHYSQLNAHLLERCQKELTRSIRGKTGTKQDRLRDDQAAFLALPKETFQPKRVAMCKATSLSLIRFDRNDYSVPVKHAHHALAVIGTVEEVRIMNKDELVATHPRDWSKENVHFDPIHYLALLERRPGALDFARPLAQWELPKCFSLLRRRLEAKEGSNGTRQYIQVLRLMESASAKQLQAAVERALDLGVLQADAVRVILEGCKEKPLKFFSLDGHPHLAGVDIAQPDLTHYGMLMERSRV